MLNPERLLQQMMREALGGSLGGRRRPAKKAGGLGGLLGGMSTATKAKVGLGLLGVAIAAYEHYRSNNANPPAAGARTPSASPPPPPPPPAHAGPAPSAPPPPPGAPAVAAGTGAAEEAMHLLRAMICAAAADGLIDAEERERILGSAREAGLEREELEALEGELAAPLTLPQLLARTRPAQREQVYVASLIAIGRETEAERQHLEALARGLGLDAAARERLHTDLGL
ncbi:MAG: hypothetical protein KatS3mg127_0229 [Silanimonas sp.]|nr:MAG: hypothetical protein KatS3mg127_0229 [Silanimonas sp.]